MTLSAFFLLLPVEQDNRETFCPGWDQSLHRWRPPSQASPWAASSPAAQQAGPVQPRPGPSSSPRSLQRPARQESCTLHLKAFSWHFKVTVGESPVFLLWSVSCWRRDHWQPMRCQREEDWKFDWRTGVTKKLLISGNKRGRESTSLLTVTWAYQSCSSSCGVRFEVHSRPWKQ